MISVVCRCKSTDLRLEDPDIGGGKGSPVGPSECADDAAAGIEPIRVRLNRFMLDKDRPAPLTLSDGLFNVDGSGRGKCAA